MGAAVFPAIWEWERQQRPCRKKFVKSFTCHSCRVAGVNSGLGGLGRGGCFGKAGWRAARRGCFSGNVKRCIKMWEMVSKRWLSPPPLISLQGHCFNIHFSSLAHTQRERGKEGGGRENGQCSSVSRPPPLWQECLTKAMNKQLRDSDWCALGLSGFEEEVCVRQKWALFCVGYFFFLSVLDT